jgi:hypothetical protein
MSKVEIQVVVAGLLRSFETELPDEAVKYVFKDTAPVGVTVMVMPPREVRRDGDFKVARGYCLARREMWEQEKP